MTAQLNRDDLKKKRDKFIVPGVKQLYSDPPHFVKGKGQFLYDETGREYLDMFAGIVTISVGHCHPKVTQRTVEQVQTLQHTSTIFLTKPMVELAEKLAEIAPDGLSKTFVTNSGTEANESAIRLARLATGRHEVIALQHSYHGESHLASTLTGNHTWRPDLMPAAGVLHAANAYCYRCPFKKTPDNCALECAKDVERVIQTQTSGKPAVMIAEPIQGVGGAITPPPEYFKEVKKILANYGVLFIADEVQTGVGRTGNHWFGISSWGVEPDMITMAKGLGNGMPIGAVIATPEIADKAQKQQINTFGGNPVSAATACAVLETIEEEGLMKNARETGEYLMDGLRDLQKHFPEMIGEVRGKGLMVGVELADRDKNPLSRETARIVELAKDEGVIIGKGGLWGSVLRVKPPMSITKENVDTTLKVLRKAMEATAKVGVS
ncbi:MAG: aspartate aminotransferase family protein [Candidatus Melainabacteria bacterium]|nr:aspartate aminotransferase family protein [Candidatus Melainabacteria bacterium]